VKVGDLVRVKYEATDGEERGVGIVVRFETYSPKEITGRGVPIILINGKELIYGRSALEVINESR